MKQSRLIILVVAIVALIIIDQVTKIAILNNFRLGETKVVIDGFFNLAYVQNTGAAFGFMRDGPLLFRQIFFLALPVVFCGWIAWMFVKTITGPLEMSVAYALILAGAIGNLIDRFRLGFVVDMFMFYWKKEEHHFHVFNVADSCVSIAGALLVIDFLKQWKMKKSEVQG
jgi:signal peptidase II